MPGNKRSSTIWFYAGIAVFALVWECCSRLFDSTLILPGPALTLAALLSIIPTQQFLLSLGNSFLRVMAGLVVSVPLGMLAGAAAGLDRRAEAFLRPLFILVAATPVMAVILIVFLWVGSELTPSFTAFLMVFPVMAANTKEAVSAVDAKLIELCDAFKITGRERVRFLYAPAVMPYLFAGFKSSLSLSWKVVAAAEIIVQPALALGTGMQNAKVNLETASLFAWTLAAVLAAGLCEALLLAVMKFFRLEQTEER